MSPKVFINPQMANVVIVATEYLVGSLSNLYDNRSRITRQLRDVIERHTNRIGYWLILMKNQVGEKLLHLFFRDDHFVVIRLELSRNPSRRIQLVQVLCILEANRKRLNRTTH